MSKHDEIGSGEIQRRYASAATRLEGAAVENDMLRTEVTRCRAEIVRLKRELAQAYRGEPKPKKERPPPISGAERARRHRARKRVARQCV
jgi:hypothetical protein